MTKLLEIKNLNVDFKTPRGRVKVLRDVNFSVTAAKIVGIVGESGSGKSTIIWALTQLLAGNGVIEQGEILFDGENVIQLIRIHNILPSYSCCTLYIVYSERKKKYFDDNSFIVINIFLFVVGYHFHATIISVYRCQFLYWPNVNTVARRQNGETNSCSFDML